MMGLGKRSADSFYPKRKKDIRPAEYLEDTGVMLGFGKRNQNKRNNFLEDTGMILGLGKRYPSVEDEGILMGFGKRNMGNEIITELTKGASDRFILTSRGVVPVPSNVQLNPRN